jgi:predicted ABC-type ATPase
MTEEIQKSVDLTFADLLKYEYGKIRSTPNPTIHIVGGQPGSGKSAVKDILLRGDANIMIIDGDEHRKHHPQYQQIKKQNPDLMPELTQEFSQVLNQKLINYAIDNKIPFAVETTFWSAEATEKLVKPAKANGFIAQLHVMAVKPEISRLYTISRFENGKENGSIGRTNAKEIHDDRVIKNVNTLRILAENGVFDSINIYGRTIKDKQSITTLIQANPTNPTETLLKERSRSLTAEELNFYAQQVRSVLFLMEKRNERAEKIQDFKNEFAKYVY